MNNNKEEEKVYIYAQVDIDKAYTEITTKSKKIKQFLQQNHLSFQFIQEMRQYKNLRICFDNQIQKHIHRKQLSPDLRIFKKNVFATLEDFLVERFELYLEDERLHQEYVDKIEDIENKFTERMEELMKNIQYNE